MGNAIGAYSKMADKFRTISRSARGWKRTVIVHPQLGRDAQEAAELASDWKKREEKQLIENIKKAIRG